MEHKKKRILTGDRPSGPLHLGHYIGSLLGRLHFQDQGDEVYVMIADVQALTDHFQTPEVLERWIIQVTQDYLSVGLDPCKTTIFIQSQIPELFELTVYFLNLVSLARLERNPTVKTERHQKGYEKNDVPAGFLCYPVSQAADITAFKADLVPVGEDQTPVLEQTNEIVQKFNRIYETQCLKRCEPYFNDRCARLIGIDGQAKASKSLGNAIFLSDERTVVQEKVRSMYTDPNHLKVSDPGKVEGNVVFSYLDAFHPQTAYVEELKAHYQKGGLGDTALKNILFDVLEDILAPIRAKRATLNEAFLRDVLWEGTKNAKAVAQATMAEVRHAMKLNYDMGKN